MNQHISQYFLRHVFQNHLHAYLPAENTTQFIYFSICTTIESLNESLKNDEEPTPTPVYHRTHNSYYDKQQWLRYTLFHSHASKGPFSHIYAMRWRNDARFSWCDELTRLSVHTVCDKTVFSTLSDLYVYSQVRNMSYASDNCRDSCFACSNAARCNDIYAMQWRNDARFSWCDESTRLSVHTACDNLCISRKRKCCPPKTSEIYFHMSYFDF